jgi:hypothetical protein
MVGQLLKASSKRQLWDVPPSQGKGRIAANVGAIALLIDLVPVVHFVYDN